jgi:predicted PurR-regulated permease PerM
MDDLAKTTDAVADLTRSASAKPPLEVEVLSSDAAYAILGVSSHFVGASIIVFVVGYFLLAMGNTLLRQAVEAQPSFLGKRSVVQLVQNVEQGISRYLLTITAINVGLGIVTGFAMWLLRVPNPVLWGVLATTLNYVPHVGAFICMVVLFVVGTVAHESIGYGGLVAGVFVVLTSVESYFLTPLVLSKSLRLSPLAVILAILFWGWMWGIPGGLMAAPLLTVVKIVSDQFQSLSWLAALLSGESASVTNDNMNLTGAPARQAA